MDFLAKKEKLTATTLVPLVIPDKKIEGDNVHEFSEEECKKGSLDVLDQGTELMPKFVSFFRT